MIPSSQRTDRKQIVSVCGKGKSNSTGSVSKEGGITWRIIRTEEEGPVQVEQPWATRHSHMKETVTQKVLREPSEASIRARKGFIN